MDRTVVRFSVVNLSTFAAWLLGASLSTLPPPCLAQHAYPAKPVKLVVSSSAGSSPDLQARLFTQRLTQLYGYTWVIENLPGAGGNIAPERVARSAPDGYTLLMASAGPLYFSASLYANLPYDIQRDFEPITQLATTPNVLVVHPGVPIRSVKELVAYAKANPGKLRFGSPGSGTSQHLSGEMFRNLAGVDIEHVPYKSSSQMTTDLMSGQFEMSFQNAPVVLPLLKTGKLRALGVTTSQRLAAVPDVPSIDEAGVPGFEIGGGSGLLAPRGTPTAVVGKIEKDIRTVLSQSDIREQYTANGWIPVASSSAEFALHLKNEISRWRPLIRASGAKVD